MGEQAQEPGNGRSDGEAPADAPRISHAAIAGSILSAAFGVQSARNKERDFSQGNYRHFIVGGIVFTVLFVLTLVVVVRLVLGG